MVKKSFRKRYRAVIFFLTVSMMLGGCESFLKKENKTEEAVSEWNEGSIAIVGDTQVDYREALVYFQSERDEYESSYGVGIWSYVIEADGSQISDWVKAQVLEQLIYVKIICSHAAEYGITLTEEELNQIEIKTAAYMNVYANAVSRVEGVTEEAVRRVYTDNAIAMKVYDRATLNVDSYVSNEEAAMHRINTIAIKKYTTDELGNKEALSEEELTKVREKADGLWRTATQTSDFKKLAKENTEDESMLEIVVGNGDLPVGYGQKVLSLNAGALSEVIETEDYYYIFYCQTPMDEDATFLKKEEIIAARQKAAFDDIFMEWGRAINVIINEEEWDKYEIN